MKASDKLLDAALRLFAERGLHATPTAAISEAAGVSTGLLFHHFKGKEALILALYVREKCRMYEAVAAGQAEGLSLRERVKRLFVACVHWMVKYPDSLRFILQVYPTDYRERGEADPALQAHARLSGELFAAGRAVGIFRDLPERLLEEMGFYQMVAIVDFATRHPEFSLTDALEGELFEAFWRIMTK